MTDKDPDDRWARDGGVYFGFGSEDTEGAPPPLRSPLCYIGDRHLFTIGPNGSGKTRRVLVPNLARLTGWSMLVIDPKGDLAHMTLAHRHKHKNKIIRLNPFNALNLGSDGFNPVAALDPTSDDFPDDALGLAEAIIRVQGQEPHWSQSAQELVAAIIMYVRLTKPGEGSLGDVRAILGKPAEEFREAVRHMMKTGENKDCEELTVKAGRFSELTGDNKELNSIVSAALTQTRWLDSRPVKGDLARGAFDFSLMKEEPVTVYLILPARRLATHSTWLRLMIAAILQALMKDTRRAQVPVLFMLDEFAQLGHLPVIENNLALMRGYGVKLWAVFQDLSQAQAIYGVGWESFLGNAGVLQSFAPQDVVTAEYISKRTGQTGKDVLNWSQSSAAGEHIAHGNITLSKQPLPLMLPQDLRNMDDGFFVMFTHKAKGTIPGYAPYPRLLPGMPSAVIALDPASQTTGKSAGSAAG